MMSRGELDRASNQLARAYADAGVGVGDFVTIDLNNSIDFYVSTLAIWKLGAVPQTVSARLPERELRSILDVVQPALVVGINHLGDITDDEVGDDRPVNFLVIDPADISVAIAETFHLASTGRPGPVLVDIPNGVLRGRRRTHGRRNACDRHRNAMPWSAAAVVDGC